MANGGRLGAPSPGHPIFGFTSRLVRSLPLKPTLLTQEQGCTPITRRSSLASLKRCPSSGLHFRSPVIHRPALFMTQHTLPTYVWGQFNRARTCRSAPRANSFLCELSYEYVSSCSTFAAMVKTQEMSVRITLLHHVRSVSARITTWTVDGPDNPLTPIQHLARVLNWAIFCLFCATSEGHTPPYHNSEPELSNVSSTLLHCVPLGAVPLSRDCTDFA